jgi:acyl carrier protein
MLDLTALRADITELVRQELYLTGDLPEGDLSESLDSVQRLQLVVAIEDHYEIAFGEDDDEAVHTLEDVVKLVAAHLEEK